MFSHLLRRSKTNTVVLVGRSLRNPSFSDNREMCRTYGQEQKSATSLRRLKFIVEDKNLIPGYQNSLQSSRVAADQSVVCSIFPAFISYFSFNLLLFYKSPTRLLLSNNVISYRSAASYHYRYVEAPRSYSVALTLTSAR